MIARLAHVCIVSTDLQETERFYCEGLGLRKVFNFTREGKVVGFYLEVSDRTFVEVFQQDAVPGPPHTPIRHLCFEVKDMDETRRRLESKGHEVTEKKLGKDGSWQAWTSDPTGVKIELHQYTEQSAQVTGTDCALD